MEDTATPSRSQEATTLLPIDEIVVENVANSQNSIIEYQYNPFPSQSQDLSQAQAGPSTSSQAYEGAEAESVLERRTRGRPPKAPPAKGTRESQRIKKETNLFNYDDYSHKWSESDRKLFLAGCMEVGIEDIEGLHRHLPHKSKDDIKCQIQMWKAIAAEKLDKQLSTEGYKSNFTQERIRNLDEWINYFNKNVKKSNDMIVFSNIFSFIAEYGDLPSPEECGGIDARAMYRYLHCMMNGVPPYGLNKATSDVILVCINNVLEMLDNPDIITILEEHMLNPPPKPDKNKFGKTYSRLGKNVTAKDIEKILSSPAMNPLKLSEKAMVIPNLDTDDEDSD